MSVTKSLSEHVKKVLEGTGKKSILAQFFSAEGLKFFADGNIGFMKLFKGYTAGTLVGTDHLGNKYYENDDLAYGRKRWVVYADSFTYSPTGVPPEWHGWLHGINDFAPGGKYEWKKPIYSVEAYVSRTGTSQSYTPKGSWKTENRNWKKYETWTPPKV